MIERLKKKEWKVIRKENTRKVSPEDIFYQLNSSIVHVGLSLALSIDLMYF